MLTIKDTRLCFLSLQLKPSFRSLLGDLCLYFWLVLCEQPTQITNSWIVWPPHSSTALGPKPHPWEGLNVTGGGAIKHSSTALGPEPRPWEGLNTTGVGPSNSSTALGPEPCLWEELNAAGGGAIKHSSAALGPEPCPWEELNNAGVEPSNTTA